MPTGSHKQQFVYSMSPWSVIRAQLVFLLSFPESNSVIVGLGLWLSAEWCMELNKWWIHETFRRQTRRNNPSESLLIQRLLYFHTFICIICSSFLCAESVFLSMNLIIKVLSLSSLILEWNLTIDPHVLEHYLETNQIIPIKEPQSPQLEPIRNSTCLFGCNFVAFIGSMDLNGTATGPDQLKEGDVI